MTSKCLRTVGAILLFTLGLAFLHAADQNAGPVASWPSVQSLASRLPCHIKIFTVAGRKAFVLLPKQSKADGLPWVWYAPTLSTPPDDSHEWMFRQWLNHGIAIAGVDVGESFGNPAGRAAFTALYEKWTREMGLAPKTCLLAQSRGGLMHYNWAAENPGRVACIVGIYPVCDLRSWPGLAQAAPAYGMTEQGLSSHLAEHNPIDRLAPLAKVRVPILHLHGDVDKVVPLDRNSAILAQRYRQLGGDIQLIVVPGRGHQVCPEFFHCQTLVDFVIARATPAKAVCAESLRPWPRVTLPTPAAVALDGTLSEALERGVARLSKNPYTVPWLLADVTFQVKREWTNYSGDVSGRFIELAALSSPAGRQSPATLAPVLAAILRYQKPDGHFGVNVDLTKPLPKASPLFPVLWGNARLLVGLVAAAEKYHDARLLAAAKRLGDFYVNTGETLCAPAREAEFRATGTGGDGYTCCYFPALESLSQLFKATKDSRYLKQAQRMAEMFWKFDTLPIDHSHGNLSAWRGVLQLYEITGHRDYLDRARAKWDAAVSRGFVWPIGGIGEHWYTNWGFDEGCSESDWLRFNLELWRYTGEIRYLDMAERLLSNQYVANQCGNGGYGARHIEGDAAGPIGLSGILDEWGACCNFHGPLGLHFLKSYLATGSDQGIFVNFPVSFTATVAAGGHDWRIKVSPKTNFVQGRTVVDIELAAQNRAEERPATLWLRMPGWATQVQSSGMPESTAPVVENGYVRLSYAAGAKHFSVTFGSRLAVEGRRFVNPKIEPGHITRLHDVSLIVGPSVLCSAPRAGSGRVTLLATVDSAGHLNLLHRDTASLLTVALPSIDADAGQIAAAIATGQLVVLQPCSATAFDRRKDFVGDLVVMPAEKVAAKDVARRFAKRAGNQESGAVPAGK